MDHFVGSIVGAVIDALRTTATFPFEILAGALADRDKVVDKSGEIFYQASEHSQRGLFSTVLDRAPALLNTETLRSKVIDLATAIFDGAGQDSQRRLVDKALNLAPALIDTGALQSALETVSSAFSHISPASVVTITGKIGKAVLDAFTSHIQTVPFLRYAVFNNAINAATLGLVWSSGSDLVRFLVDILDCTKTYALNTSSDGQPDANDQHGRFNELDLTKAMNRHAVYCQVQRLMLSLTYIWERLTDNIHMGTVAIDQVNMSERTILQTDDRPRDSDPFTVTPAPPPVGVAVANFGGEEWLFVNGIAGEYHWTRLACEKLADRFSRKVTGIMNRGDGILWDLIECAGERDARGRGTSNSQGEFVQRTQSSREAQKKLVESLRKALARTAERIVVIAHSQGCLLLRLALGELVRTADPADLADLATRLCVFTFGNPSVDWDLDNSVPDTVANRHLIDYVLRTEHFANTKDFVAKLGVLSRNPPVDPQFYGNVFSNDNSAWVGHLFGAQYSLDPVHYSLARGQTSWLLACDAHSAMQ